MTDENTDDIGFTKTQQDWIRQLIASQQKDTATTEGNGDQSGAPLPVTSSQSHSAGNLGELASDVSPMHNVRVPSAAQPR